MGVALMAKKTARKKTEASLEVGDRLPFGELALLLGYINREDLGQALRDQVLKNQKIGTLLIQQGAMTKEQAREVLRMQKREGPIEGYKLLQRIGAGGMGTVYRARQKSLKRQVAIKILNFEAAGNSVQRRRFIQEGHLLAQLQHPNLIQCYDIGECDDIVYLVMEFVEGRNARELLMHEGNYEESFGLEMLAQCLEAMSHYHEKAIIHRDIKPENLLISEDQVAKITDLGLSKQLTNDLFLTRVGKTVGTPYYISPELARGDSDIDIRSDLYSLGATFFHLFCGVPPFDGESSAEILTRHVKEPPTRPSKLNDALSRGLDHILLKLLEKSVRKRYQSPNECLEDVRALQESGQLDSSTAGKRRRPTTGTHPSVRSSGIIRGNRHRSGARSSVASRERTRGSGVRSSASGAHRRSSLSGAGRGAGSLRKRENRMLAILGGVGVLLLTLILGITIGLNSSNPNGPGGNDPSENPSFQKARAELKGLVAHQPREAVISVERWASQSRRHDETIKRWEIVLARPELLNNEFLKRAKAGLDRARRALEEQASEQFDKIRNAFYVHFDENQYDQAAEQLDKFPAHFKGTMAWKNWENLKQQLKDARK